MAKAKKRKGRKKDPSSDASPFFAARRFLSFPLRSYLLSKKDTRQPGRHWKRPHGGRATPRALPCRVLSLALTARSLRAAGRLGHRYY